MKSVFWFILFIYFLVFQVGPVGLLYVNQREMAVVASHDKNVTIIGSDDATTCIIVIVRHLGKREFHIIETMEAVSCCFGSLNARLFT